jgi:2-polyprenyl-6-hydroxyphenyl methylase/3-demethylubiquinone-9 3-methyltransferase
MLFLPPMGIFKSIKQFLLKIYNYPLLSKAETNVNQKKIRDAEWEAIAPFVREESEFLDVGCGGGLLAEPMNRLGFDVTAIDASEKNIKTALTHAAQMELNIDYRAMTAEQLALEDKDGFDVVLNMEVIEHVEDPRAFVATTASLVRPGGMMIIATLNRTMKALGMAIIGAEYVLGWLPKGTHSFSKFLKPQEILDFLEPTALKGQSPVGVSFNPLFDRFSLSDDCSVNYMVLAKRPT